jgi:hypothetical protein
MIGTVFLLTAVQEERQRVKEKGEGEVESTSSANSDMPVEKVLEAELAVEPKTDTYIDAQVRIRALDLVMICTLFCLSCLLKNTQYCIAFTSLLYKCNAVKREYLA